MRVGTTGRALPEDWETQKSHMNSRIAVLVATHGIPKVCCLFSSQSTPLCFCTTTLVLALDAWNDRTSSRWQAVAVHSAASPNTIQRILHHTQSLVVNADQTGLLYTPSNSHGRAPKGSKIVHQHGTDDTRQVMESPASELRLQ
jgi:hypothetical protein